MVSEVKKKSQLARLRQSQQGRFTQGRLRIQTENTKSAGHDQGIVQTIVEVVEAAVQAIRQIVGSAKGTRVVPTESTNQRTR